jgi:uncharacterized membrane protein
LQLLILVAILIVGAGLRFWNLDAKPLWMDEVITALFSLGRNYYQVPLEQVLPDAALDQLFKLNPTACADITQTVSVQSVHPPLFFCWLHQWMQVVPGNWIWRLRSLPALAGVGAIAAVYWLNRIAFSKTAGLIGAIVMAVSPFAVYLSQEARHYTIPMVLILMALVGLIRIQQDLQQQRLNFRVWFGWVIVNSIGFYVHYFFLLAVVAQIVTLIGLQIWRIRLGVDRRSMRSSWIAIVISILGIGLSYLPWLPTLISHMTRPESDWLQVHQAGWLRLVAPLYQLVAGWLVMVIALPFEQQPTWIVVTSVILMITFGIWLASRVIKGFIQRWKDPQTHWTTLTLTSVLIVMVLEFLAIVYILNKDITQVPRYNFIYYPIVCALIGASLTHLEDITIENQSHRRFVLSRYPSILVLLFVGTLSCILVVSNVVFLKPYLPDRVAQMIRSSQSSLVVMAYDDFQDIALGLSFALALQRSGNEDFALLSRATGYERFWRNLRELPQNQPKHLWTIAPGLRKRDFPPQLALKKTTCTANPDKYDRIGIPYQGYDCPQ